MRLYLHWALEQKELTLLPSIRATIPFHSNVLEVLSNPMLHALGLRFETNLEWSGLARASPFSLETENADMDD